VCVYPVFVLFCVGLAKGWSLVQGVLPSVKKLLQNWIRGPDPEWAGRAIGKKRSCNENALVKNIILLNFYYRPQRVFKKCSE
jgi:hypothetical protein